MPRLCTCLLALIPLLATADDLSGKYLTHQDGIPVLLVLNGDDSMVTGHLEVEGEAHPLQGKRNGNQVSGTLSFWGESQSFTASEQNGQLTLRLPIAGNPNGAVESLLFQRIDSAAPTTSTAPPPGAGNVVVNGITLNEHQLADMEARYQARPMPGEYWYDTTSGLYGVIGYQAFGFMFPGHNFGSLDENASAGNTGVYVNGRHLPLVEWAIWSQLLGYQIQQGRYWLDAQGSAGAEGNPTPLDNLYLAAQRNAYRGGGGGGGDNTWNTRFSAGNYDQGNTRGYVSVPGHGPVGYGF